MTLITDYPMTLDRMIEACETVAGDKTLTKEQRIEAWGRAGELKAQKKEDDRVLAAILKRVMLRGTTTGRMK